MAHSWRALALVAATWGRGYGWSCNDAGATNQLDLFSLSDVDPLAVCNDGTPAAARARVLFPSPKREATYPPPPLVVLLYAR